MVLKKKRKLLRGTERLENKGFMNDLFFLCTLKMIKISKFYDKVEEVLLGAL